MKTSLSYLYLSKSINVGALFGHIPNFSGYSFFHADLILSQCLNGTQRLIEKSVNSLCRKVSQKNWEILYGKIKTSLFRLLLALKLSQSYSFLRRQAKGTRAC